MKRKFTFKTQIIVFVVVLLMLLLICQVVFNLFLSRKVFILTQQKEIEKVYQEIKENYTADYQEISSYMSVLEEEKNMVIQIADKNGILYSSIRDKSFMHSEKKDNNNDRKHKKINFEYQPKAVVVEKFPIDGRKIQLAGRFSYKGKEQYVLLIYDLSSTEEMTLLFIKTSIMIAVLMIIVGIIAAFFVTQRMVKPLSEIEKSARYIAKLEFGYVAPKQTNITELDSLATSINSMSEDLNTFILQLKTANKKLENDVKYQKKLEKMRREFISNVSHEMKTPLCLLLMYSEGLKNNMDKIDKDYYCNTIMEEAVRLDKMVKNLLDMSSIENGLSKIQMDWFDFSKLLSDSVDKMKPIMKNIDVEVSIQERQMVFGDQYYLEQAVSNYISNAVSYSNDGCKIRIVLANEEDYHVFSVYNQGENIPPDKIKHVWDSFYQVDESRSRDGNHVGLGLYIVKTIIHAHDGKYGVENTEHGVKFWFGLKKNNMEIL